MSKSSLISEVTAKILTGGRRTSGVNAREVYTSIINETYNMYDGVAAALTGTEILPLIQTGVSKQITLATLAAYLGGGVPTFASVLGVGNTSGGTNVIVSPGDELFFNKATVNTLSNTGIDLYSSGITNRFTIFVSDGSAYSGVATDADELYLASINSSFHFRPNNVETLSINAMAKGDTAIIVTGASALSTKYGLKVLDSTNAAKFAVRNDGRIFFGGTTWDGAAAITNTVSGYIQNDSAQGFRFNDSIYGAWQLLSSGTNAAASLNINHAGAGHIVVINDDGFGVGLSTAGTVAPGARIHAKGNDASSVNYALKLENSLGATLMFARNDGETRFVSGLTQAMKGFFTYTDVNSVRVYDATGTKKYLDIDPNGAVAMGWDGTGSKVYVTDTADARAIIGFRNGFLLGEESTNNFGIYTGSLWAFLLNKTTSVITYAGNGLYVSGTGIDTTATGGSDVLNIGATNANVINYGNASTIHNFLGTAIYELQVNSYVTDKLITLNYGGGFSTAIGVGFEIEEAASITGYFKTNAARSGYLMKAPAVDYYAELSLANLTSPHTYLFPNTAASSVTLMTVEGGQYITSGGLGAGSKIVLGSDNSYDMYYAALAGGDLTRLATANTSVLTTTGTGQPQWLAQGSAFNKSFGTTAGTITQGNDSRIKGYAMYCAPMTTTLSPGTGAVTYFAGHPIVNGFVNTGGTLRMYPPVSGTITAVVINGRTVSTLGTGELSTFSVRVNDTTDTLIGTTSTNSASWRTSNLALGIAVTTADYFEIKWEKPAQVTASAAMNFAATIYIQ